jgi:adenine/guanine phosphoribosyltransferase-like PRPP-binding protein
MMYVKQRHHLKGRTTMSIERLARNAGFAIAAAAIVFALGFTIEFQPVINALAH